MENNFKVMLGVMIDNSSLSQAQKDIAKQRLEISANISVEDFAKSRKEIENQIEHLAAKIKDILGTAISDKQATQWAKQYYGEMVSGAKQAAKEQERLAKEQEKQATALKKQIADNIKQETEYQNLRKKYKSKGDEQAKEAESLRQSMEYYEKEKYYQETRAKFLAEGKAQQEAYNAEVKETAEYYKQFAIEADKAYASSQKIATQNISKADSIKISVDNGDYSTQILQYETALQRAGIAGQELAAKMSEAKTAYNNLVTSTTGNDVIPETVIANAEKLNSEMTKLKNEVKTINLSDSLRADDIKVDSAIIRISEQLRNNSAYSKDAKVQLHAFLEELNRGDVSVARLAQINSEAKKLHANMASLNKIGKSFGDTIKDQAAKFTQWLSISSILMKTFRTIRSGTESVINLDTALVDLEKTTDATASQLSDFYYQSNEIAKSLGSTTEEVINATSAWSRLGYSIQDAMTMAENSSIFASISPEMDIDTATDGLVSMMKAFDVDAEDSLDGIISKVNEVGNSFAVSNDMIVEAMKRSSAAMVAANNSLDQTIAMNTAATEITQNAEITSNALRTLSMRVRGYDEETEEYIGGIEELTGEIADLTKTAATPGGISLFTDDTKQTYKSTYDLLDEISTIYDDLSDKNQAGLLEILAGKRSAQSVAALISNFDKAREAMDVMNNSAGGAMEEMDIIYDSLDYKLNKLSETGTGVAQNLFARDDMKAIVDGLTSVMEVIDTITNKLGLFGTLGSGAGLAVFVKGIKNLDWLEMPSHKESCLDFLVGLV